MGVARRRSEAVASAGEAKVSEGDRRRGVGEANVRDNRPLQGRRERAAPSSRNRSASQTVASPTIDAAERASAPRPPGRADPLQDSFRVSAIP